MPFMIDADEAAKAIADGLESGRPEIVFPLPMAAGMKLLDLVPHRLWTPIWKRQSRLPRSLTRPISSRSAGAYGDRVDGEVVQPSLVAVEDKWRDDEQDQERAEQDAEARRDGSRRPGEPGRPSISWPAEPPSRAVSTESLDEEHQKEHRQLPSPSPDHDVLTEERCNDEHGHDPVDDQRRQSAPPTGNGAGTGRRAGPVDGPGSRRPAGT